MFRKILIGAVVLLAVLAVVAVAVVMLVDVNRFKPTIESFVKERYQRTLRIDGDLGIAAFPNLALSLPRSSLSERGGAGEAASVEGARVSVALIPLLRGRIVADKVKVDGLQAFVERRTDGSLSIDDLIGTRPASSSAPAPAGTAPGPGPAQAPRELPRLDLGGIGVTRGRVTFRDQQAGRTVTISGLEVDTGKIANQGVTPVTLKLAFSSDSPAATGSLDLKAQAQVDLDLNVFGARSLDATLKAASGTTRLDGAHVRLADLAVDPGRKSLNVSGLELDARGALGSDPLEAKLSVPRLAVTEASLSGDPLQASVKLSGARVLDARMTASGLGGSLKALTLDRLAIDASTSGDGRTVKATLTSPARADFSAGSVDLPGLAGSVLIEDPALPQKKAAIELTGSGSADSSKETVVGKLDVKSEGSTLLAEFDVIGFSRPKVGFEVSADRLDLDRYFPAAPASAAVSPPAGSPGGGAAPGPAADAAKAGGPEAPIDLSALADLDLSGSLSVGQLQARGLKVSDLKVALKARDGRLDAAPVTAGLYGGRLSARSVVKAGATPAANRIDATVDLAGISIGPLLRDLAKKDLLEGQGNLNLVLNAGGGTAAAMKRGLDGSAVLALRNGAIKGINLGETIRSARNLLQVGGRTETKPSDSQKQTDFTELGVSFLIADGIATSNDLDVKSPLLRLGGEGRADLVASRLDYMVRASVVGTSTGQGGKELADVRGVTIPVKLAGPFDKLDWQIDWESAGKEALKSRAAAELKERLKTDDIEGKAREKLGGALKGLFKR